MTTPIAPLTAYPWKTSYRHEDGDLVELFYVPALSCAVTYDRMTGYFSADALALAARGIERLIANGGRMRLLVGCTLDDAEVQAIQQGYDLREQLAARLVREPLTPPDATARRGLEALAWMVAHGLLDVKVALPVDGAGRLVAGPALYHEKVGILADAQGNRLGFSGSINETRGGWVNNRESFHVHCSWEAGRDAQHVADEVHAFARLWADRAGRTRVFSFPDAARARLLEFLPTDERFAAPPRTLDLPERAEGEANPLRLNPAETRRVVWAYVSHAARLATGVRVGELTGAVRPWPHQLRTFARLLDAWPCRMLLSDEVGLGKTISAGLLVRQAWLSGLAGRILILTPRAVLAQWQNELYEKFNLDVPVYDGQKLAWRPTHSQPGPRELRVERDAWHCEPLVLASSHLMRRRDRAAELFAAENWDLVVLDEAHHARRHAPGTPQEGGPNALMRLMRQLKDRCRALLLLTATPMQVHPVEVWDLLDLLGLPALWQNRRHEFDRYFQLAGGNPSQAEMEFLAEMFRGVEEGFGKLDEGQVARVMPTTTRMARERVLSALRDAQSGILLKRLSNADRQLALVVLRRFSPLRYRMARHTRELLRLYHARGLLATPIGRRDVRDVAVVLTPAERSLYDAVEEYISTTYNSAAPETKTAVGFVMTIYRRRLASSFYALRRTLTKRLAHASAGQPLLLDDEDLPVDELADETLDSDQATELAGEARVGDERPSINELLRRIAQLGTDSKAKRLKTELEQAFAEGYPSAIIFTQYSDTMDYLAQDFLAAELPNVSIACYSGSGGRRRDSGGFWTTCGKEQIKRAFKDGSVQLLVCTDAAGEGLNFQFCGMLVNYDLPWNPMKVEQRIGRIDRIGQRHEIIRVVNLAYEDTVEADVFFALGQRINLFQGVVGKLQPILSRLPRAFEKVVLEPADRKKAGRERVLADVVHLISEAKAAPFDIDEVAAESLELPALPPAALTLEDIERIMGQPELRSPELEWASLDAGSFALRLPGMADKVRVTTRADVFEDQFESHDLFSPGAALFERLANQELGPPQNLAGVTGSYWLVKPTAPRATWELICFTNSRFRSVASLRELFASFDLLASARPLDLALWPDACGWCLA